MIKTGGEITRVFLSVTHPQPLMDMISLQLKFYV